MLFDEDRAKKKLRTEDERRVASGQPRIEMIAACRSLNESREGEPMTPSEELSSLQKRVKMTVDNSAYNWVEPSIWSKILGPQ